MNEPLYWRDQEAMAWPATVLESSTDGIVLDESAFYPGGGGQPADAGVLEWTGVFTRVAGVSAGNRLVPVEGDPVPPAGTTVTARLDDERRRSLMRTHSALHVLCGVMFRDFGAVATGSNMEPLAGRLDCNLDQVPEGFKASLEQSLNEEIAHDRAITARIVSRAEALRDAGVMRTAQSLIPDWMPRPMRAPTWPPPARSARCRSPRSRARGAASAGSGCGSPRPDPAGWSPPSGDRTPRDGGVCRVVASVWGPNSPRWWVWGREGHGVRPRTHPATRRASGIGWPEASSNRFQPCVPG